MFLYGVESGVWGTSWAASRVSRTLLKLRGWVGFPRDDAVEKGLISFEGRNLWVFSGSVQSVSFTQYCQALMSTHESQHTRLPVHLQLPEFLRLIAHQVSDVIQPSSLLLAFYILLLSLPASGLSNSSMTLKLSWPKYWSFFLNHPFQRKSQNDPPS